MMDNTTENKLLEALERIKNGNPIHIDKKKKLSFSAVEDEALLSRSLSRHYPEVFNKIKNEIELLKSKKISLNHKIEEPKSMRDENIMLKEQIKLLKTENQELLSANVGLSERILFLNRRFKNEL